MLGYGTLPPNVIATPGAGSVTFTGAASVAEYQQLLQSVTLTSSGTGIKTVMFTVVDDSGRVECAGGHGGDGGGVCRWRWRRWW